MRDGREGSNHRVQSPRGPGNRVERPLPTINRAPLNRQARTILRERILTGELAPGHHLVEWDIAAQLGVSRAPVREAIRQLEQEGLVEFFPHRGAVVIGADDEEIDTIYQLRAVVEARAMARACQLRTQAQVEELDALLIRLEHHIGRRELEAATECDIEFHRTLVEVSGYAVLRRFWDSFDGIVRVRSMQALERPGPVSEQFLSTGVSSHRQLLDALRQGDSELGARLAREHVMEVPARIHE